jgi:hypothetical protein
MHLDFTRPRSRIPCKYNSNVHQCHGVHIVANLSLLYTRVCVCVYMIIHIYFQLWKDKDGHVVQGEVVGLLNTRIVGSNPAQDIDVFLAFLYSAVLWR